MTPYRPFVVSRQGWRFHQVNRSLKLHAWRRIAGPIAVALLVTCCNISCMSVSLAHVRISVPPKVRRDDGIDLRRQQIVFLGKCGEQTAHSLRFDLAA